MTTTTVSVTDSQTGEHIDARIVNAEVARLNRAERAGWTPVPPAKRGSSNPTAAQLADTPIAAAIVAKRGGWAPQHEVGDVDQIINDAVAALRADADAFTVWLAEQTAYAVADLAELGRPRRR